MKNNKRLNAINNKSEEAYHQRYVEIMNLWDNFKKFHQKHPELRMGQFLSIFENWSHITYGKDIFYVEDDILSLQLERFIKSFGKDKD